MICSPIPLKKSHQQFLTENDPKKVCPICLNVFFEKTERTLLRFYGHEVLLSKQLLDKEILPLNLSLKADKTNRVFHLKCEECHISSMNRFVSGTEYDSDKKCPSRCGIFEKEIALEEFLFNKKGVLIDRKIICLAKKQEIGTDYKKETGFCLMVLSGGIIGKTLHEKLDVTPLTMLAFFVLEISVALFSSAKRQQNDLAQTYITLAFGTTVSIILFNTKTFYFLPTSIALAAAGAIRIGLLKKQELI